MSRSGTTTAPRLTLDEVRCETRPGHRRPGDNASTPITGSTTSRCWHATASRERPITFDTMIAAYLIGDSSIRLKDLAFTRLGIEMTEITELIGTGRNQATMDTVAIDLAAPYACGDVESTYGLVEPLRAVAIERDQLPLMEDLELPLIPVLMHMERAGVAIDSDLLAGFSAELGQRIDEIKLK